MATSSGDTKFSWRREERERKRDENVDKEKRGEERREEKQDVEKGKETESREKRLERIKTTIFTPRSFCYELH